MATTVSQLCSFLPNNKKPHPHPFITANDMPAPFNTQFFHEDDFGGGFDDDGGYDGEGGGMPDEDAGEQDLLAATAGQTRRVRPEFVNYAKRAKRVDVRKLKENIWKGLDIVVKKEPETQDEDESMVRHSLLFIPWYFFSTLTDVFFLIRM